MDERRGDWEHGVDENLASLNSGQRSQDEKLEKLEDSQEEVEAVLHGETDSGLIGRIEDLEVEVSRLNAVIFQDALGKKGLHHDIQAILAGREDRRDSRGNWTKIVVAIITSGALGLFWKDIQSFLNKTNTGPKHTKSRVHHIVIKQQTQDPDED